MAISKITKLSCPFWHFSLLFCSLERIKVQKVLKVKRLFVSLSHIYDRPESDYIHYTIQYIGSRILYIKKKPSWTVAALEAERLPVIIPRWHPIKCCCHSCCCHCILLPLSLQYCSHGVPLSSCAAVNAHHHHVLLLLFAAIVVCCIGSVQWRCGIGGHNRVSAMGLSMKGWVPLSCHYKLVVRSY